MSDKTERDRAIGEMLALVVHDLRNPVATISANLSFIRDVAGVEDPDAIEALDDVDIALADLTRGLEQLGWVGRWIGGHRTSEAASADARPNVEQGVRRAGVDAKLQLPDEPVVVSAAGNALGRLTELLVRNAAMHASPTSIEVELRATDDGARLEVRDSGAAVAEDLRAEIFTLAGQHAAKGRADGRYSRVVGLLAARALADALGATIRAEGDVGSSCFVVDLPA